MTAVVHHGDCLDVLRGMADNSVDSIVTDPPYGLSFMGKKWDYDVPAVEVWAECLRVLKPGGHLLAFAGTRTQHRMAVRIEDAGFEIRDMIAWVYGSGFPKSLDVSKAIDKAAGIEREVVGLNPHARPSDGQQFVNMGTKGHDPYITSPATEAARQWQGWGTALKPALEPITVARKPLTGTVASNVLEWGTGALNIEGCRVATEDNLNGGTYSECGKSAPMPGDERTGAALGMFQPGAKPDRGYMQPVGRWPANLIHDGSEEVTEQFPVTGASKASMRGEKTSAGTHAGWARESHKGFDSVRGHNDNGGSAARFFYCAKASKADRGDNAHPTVKPTDLMRYLCRLVTPAGGIVLDPFSGSGSTGKAAVLEGFEFVGIEREAAYVQIAQTRIEHAHTLRSAQTVDLFGEAA